MSNPYETKAKLPEGFKPTYERMSDDQAKMLLTCTMAEASGEQLPEQVIGDLFPSAIVKKRVDVLGLPIKFTNNAYVAISAFCRGPGHAVALLVDCLNTFENEEITVTKLVDLYPLGFYDNDSLGTYIDNYLKPKKHKWAEIY